MADYDGWQGDENDMKGRTLYERSRTIGTPVRSSDAAKKELARAAAYKKLYTGKNPTKAQLLNNNRIVAKWGIPASPTK